MANINAAVLNLLKNDILLSATEIERRLGLAPDPRQKAVRNSIDALRGQGEPIWHGSKGFWWRDDQPVLPVGVPNRWKRPYSIGGT